MRARQDDLFRQCPFSGQQLRSLAKEVPVNRQRFGAGEGVHRRAAVDLTAPPDALQSIRGGCLRGINHGLATDDLGRPGYGQLLARSNDANASRSFIGGNRWCVLIWGFWLKHNRRFMPQSSLAD